MIHIRPVSDLRNKFPEIEEIVLNKNVPVFLTKNGHGSMVVLSVEQYTTLMESVERELDVVHYIAVELNNPSAASRLVDEIERAIFQRLLNPLSFQAVPSNRVHKHPYYRIRVKNFSIYYVVIGHTMEVRRLLYRRRNIDSLLH